MRASSKQMPGEHFPFQPMYRRILNAYTDGARRSFDTPPARRRDFFVLRLRWLICAPAFHSFFAMSQQLPEIIPTEPQIWHDECKHTHMVRWELFFARLKMNKNRARRVVGACSVSSVKSKRIHSLETH
jgi:hypothetical protein